MNEGDGSGQRRSGLSAARWVLIAVCAVLILFSDSMAGRLGFAALLVLAIVIGRYTSRRTRVLDSGTLPSNQAPKAPAPDLPRREAGH
jgi:hypothetical protein